MHRVEVGGRQADHGTLASGRLAVHLAASGLLAVAFVVPPAFVESPAYRGVSVPLVFSIHDLACAEDLLHGLELGLRGELEIRLQVETLPRKLGGPWIQLRLQSQNGLLIKRKMYTLLEVKYFKRFHLDTYTKMQCKY